MRFICPICHSDFSSLSDLEGHVQKVHGLDPIKVRDFITVVSAGCCYVINGWFDGDGGTTMIELEYECEECLGVLKKIIEKFSKLENFFVESINYNHSSGLCRITLTVGFSDLASLSILETIASGLVFKQ